MVVADLGAIVSLLAETTISVQRYAAGSYVDGAYVRGAAEAPIEALASVQPAPGRDVQRLPEGTRTGETVAIYTSGLALRAPDPEAGLEGDLVTIGGRVFRVQLVEDWTGAGNYGRALAVLEGPV